MVAVLLSLHAYIWLYPETVLATGVGWGLFHVAQREAVPVQLRVLQRHWGTGMFASLWRQLSPSSPSVAASSVPESAEGQMSDQACLAAFAPFQQSVPMLPDICS